MKKQITLAGLWALVFTGIGAMAQNISADRLKKDVSFLASDKLKGRGTSSEEELMAAKYISAEFAKLKLSPLGDIGNPANGAHMNERSFLYEFTFKKNTNPHDTSTVNIPDRKGYDVVAYLDNGAPYTIVIGGHYDHLGLGHDHNSLDANPDGKIHHGADDNASGTAGVLELARYFVNNKKTEKYNFLFMCFSGEELGLLGSKKWCDRPTLPLEKINYMINMDMIGRLNDSTQKLLVYGVGTSPAWVPLLDKTNSTFSIKKDSSGIGPSDQTSFYLKDIPVLHFFTGQHKDYHKPSDVAEKVNYKGEVKVLEYICQLIAATDDMPKFAFTKTAAPASNTNSFKVTMGVMPDYAFEGKGMRIDGVSDNKPAAKAGVKTGDIVIGLGGEKVNNVMDYMKALSNFKKGDTTTVKVLRDTKELELQVTF
ncbi:MAG: M28 family peptidase [Bacteroidetes bacterium]|nr:M28 family peptidase [Bacteroidota bacterium]